jgi:SET domain-containing protein
MGSKQRRRSGRRIAAVRPSPIHGSGLFALRDIAPGRHIDVYEGRRYGPDTEREWDHGLTYVFGLSDGTMIDGSEDGNDARHINHSCEPNCAAYEMEHEDGTLAIVIETVRSVRRGDELLLDYALDVGDADQTDYPCCCEAPICRGTMVRV